MNNQIFSFSMVRPSPAPR